MEYLEGVGKGEERVQGSGFRKRGQRSGQGKQKSLLMQGAGGRGGAVGAKRSLKHTGARPVDGAGRGQRGSGTAGTAF